MWITRKHYDDMRLDVAKCREEARVLDQQNVHLQHTVSELCQRLNVSEHERVLLIKNYMGITLPAPEFVPSPASVRNAHRAPEVPLDIPAVLGAGGMFGDMGDTEAKKLGIDWDGTGKVVTPSEKQ